MQNKPFNNELEDLLYSKSHYDPYGMDKALRKIIDSDWPNDIKYNTPTENPGGNIDNTEDNIDFESRFLADKKKNQGYVLDKGYMYEDSGIVKIKKFWESKGFWYKFFIFDLIAGAIVELILHHYSS